MGICFSSDTVENRDSTFYSVYRNSGYFNDIDEVPLMRCECRKKKNAVSQMIYIYNQENKGIAQQLFLDLNSYFSSEQSGYHRCDEVKNFLETKALLKIYKFCFQKFVDEGRYDQCKEACKSLKGLRRLISSWKLDELNEKKELVTLIYRLNSLCLYNTKNSSFRSDVKKLVSAYQEKLEYIEILNDYALSQMSNI